MTKMHNRDAPFEQVLRDAAHRDRRAPPPGLAFRIMSQVCVQQKSRPSVRGTSGRWYRAAFAASVAIAATIAAAILLDGFSLTLPSNQMPPIIAFNDAERDVAAPGPMAMFASLHAAPEELSGALRHVMNREVNLLLEGMWREPQRMIAHLPLQGRLDHDSESGH